MCEFEKQYAIDYLKTAAVLQEVTDERKAVNEKNARTALNSRADDIQEATVEVTSVAQPKRRQTRSFYFTTEAVRHSGCASALLAASHSPQPEGQDSQSHSWYCQKSTKLYDLAQPTCSWGCSRLHAGGIKRRIQKSFPPNRPWAKQAP